MNAVADLAPLLRKVPLFSCLSDNDAEILLASGRRASFKPGDPLLRQGDEGTAMHLLIVGNVQVLQEMFDGSTRLVTTREAGSVIGEMALIDGNRRSASVVALDHCRTLVIEKRAFDRCVRRNPDLAFALLTALVQTIRDQNSRLSQPTDVRSKVLNFLSDLVTRAEATDAQVVEIQIGANLAQLAPRLGMTRETLSRTISELTAERVLQRKGRKVMSVHKGRLMVALDG